MYPYVRLATCASLVAFIGLISVSGSVLLYKKVGRPLPANTEVSRPDTVLEVTSRSTEADLPFNASASAPPPHESESNPPSTQRTAMPSPELLPQSSPTPPEQGTSIDPQGAGALHVEGPSIKTKARALTPKKTAHHRPDERRRTNEALNSMRRFGDRYDVPVNAYAPDEARRPIRPTSIQDIYYYSIPR
jgi:hypothetical protein